MLLCWNSCTMSWNYFCSSGGGRGDGEHVPPSPHCICHWYIIKNGPSYLKYVHSAKGLLRRMRSSHSDEWCIQGQAYSDGCGIPIFTNKRLFKPLKHLYTMWQQIFYYGTILEMAIFPFYHQIWFINGENQEYFTEFPFWSRFWGNSLAIWLKIL